MLLLLVRFTIAASPDPHAALCAELRSPKVSAARTTSLAPGGHPELPCHYEDVEWQREGHSGGWVIFGLFTAGIGFLFPDLGADYHPVTREVDILPLELALHTGRPDLVTPLVTAGAALEAPLTNSETALVYAVRVSIDGSPALARTLLELGASATPLDGAFFSSDALAVATGPLAAELRAHGMPVDLTDRMGRTLLFDVADAGDLAAAQALLAIGANPNAGAQGYDPPLLAAATRGDLEMMRLLLSAHADPEKGGFDSPLHAAAKAGHTEAVCLLLEAGANPSGVTRGSDTALGAAVSNRDLAMVRLLLDAGANPSGTRSVSRTPLGVAIDQGAVPMVQILLDAGADPNGGMDPPLLLAIRADRLDLADLLVAHGADPLAHFAFDETLLTIAAGENRPAAVEWALAHGLPADDTTGMADTPLTAAAERGALDAIRVLLAHGADPLATHSTFDHPPVAIAVRHGNVAATTLLFEALDPRHQHTWLPFLLHDAVETGGVKVANYLLAKGATLAAAFPATGQGPMHLAADRDQWAMVEWLKARGVSVDEVDVSGTTPLRAALLGKDRAAADELLSRGATLAAAGGPTLYAVAAGNDDVATIDWLLAHRVPATAIPGNGALAAAVGSGSAACFARLVEAGADPKARLADGGTLLHVAAGTDKTPLMDLLLDTHADPNAVDTSGTTPLDRAMARRDAPTVRRLLQAGASPLPVSGGAKHPLQSAVDNTCRACLTALLGAGATSATPINVPLADSDLARLLDEGRVPNTLRGTLEEAITSHDRGAADLLLERGATVTPTHLVLAVSALELLPWLLTKTDAPQGADRRAILREARAAGVAREVRQVLKEAKGGSHASLAE